MNMSLIEGIGDEVVEFFVVLVVAVVGFAAWWSTRIADRPLIRTVLVFERRAHNRHAHGSEPGPEQSEQRNYVQELPSATGPGPGDGQDQGPGPGPGQGEDRTEDDKPPEAGGSGSGADGDGDERDAIVENMDSEASVLRQRRLEFFEHRQEDGTAEAETQERDSDHDDGIRIKLKYINDDLKLVDGRLREPLGDFKRRHFEPELADDKLVKLIFNGQVLQRDEDTLQSCGLFDNCVVHCLVHPKRLGRLGERSAVGSEGTGAERESGGRSSGNAGLGSGGREQQRDRDRDWDLGNLFFAIVSFILGAAWYFRYEYAQLYTVTATVALVALTGIFTVFLIGMYFPDPEPPARVQN